MRSDCVRLSNKYAKIVMPSARFLNQSNKIRDTKLQIYPSSFVISTPSLKNLPSPESNESLPYWFQGNFAASFVFNFCLREFLSSAFANRFELRCEPKRLMLLYYKICPCSSQVKRWLQIGKPPREKLERSFRRRNASLPIRIPIGIANSRG